jgi:HK97 family phage major capsid protein
VATLVETDRGTEFSFPMDDDTSAVATVVAENAESVTNSPVTFGSVAFDRCPMWRSGHIVGSMELAADSAFPLSTVLAGMFGRRMARGIGGQFINQHGR